MKQPFGIHTYTGAKAVIKQTNSTAAWWLLGLAMALAAMPAIAQEATQIAPQVKPLEEWHNFASSKGKPKHLGDSNVVFMRTQEAINGRPITIYINGEYLTTLLPGGYKGVRVCSGKNSVGTAYITNDMADVDKHKRNPQHWFEMPKDSKKILYVALTKSPEGYPTLKTLKPDPAIEMLKTLKEQTHALSRVTSNCAQ